MYMARSTWTQVRDYFKRHDLVIIGVGSTECHGRHNPLGTDTMAPDRILELLERRDGTYLVAPTLPYGATDDLVGYPGTVSLGVQGLYDVLSSITRQLVSYGARRFVFLNGHGGNVKSLSMVSMDLNDAGCLAAVVNWWKVAPQLNPAWGGGHGGAMETSANLAIDPASVDMSQVTDEGLLHDIGEDMPSCGWNTVSFGGAEVEFPRRLARFASSGWVAEGHEDHPSGASAELGTAMLEGTATWLQGFTHALEAEELPQLRALLARDAVHLDDIQLTTAATRAFALVVRLRSREDRVAGAWLADLEKTIRSHGFQVRRAGEQDLMRLLAVYYEQNITTEPFYYMEG